MLTLPLVLPPTVVGYLLLRLFGPKHLIGLWFLETFDLRLVMTWWSAIFATVVVAFPLMYRTARGAFESFDETLADAGRTLGLSNSYIFWNIRMPCCKQGILAGAVLAFARALGEYGATAMIAGYTPGRTATISTTVYQLWRTNDDALALKWVLINIAISTVVLLSINLLERRKSGKEAAA
jgi:molybdate transport system permease protein